MTAFMPKSYLDSQSPPNFPIKDWLTWLVLKLESSIVDASNKIAGLMGINKAGDLQYVFMPVIVPKALGNNATVVLGNSTDINSEPTLVYLDMSNLGLTSVIETFTKIPDDICPEEHLPSKFVRGTIWETAKVPLGLACIPIITPIFFGMHAVKASVYDFNFNDKLALLSAKHLQWAKLIKENVNQQENNDKDYDKILVRISTNTDPNSKYITPIILAWNYWTPLLFKCSLSQRINGRIAKQCFEPFSKGIQAPFISLELLWLILPLPLPQSLSVSKPMLTPPKRP
jgi:hypothetical protein